MTDSGPVDVAGLRASGRQAHRDRSWRRSADALRAADAVEPLDPADLALLAEAALLSGDHAGSLRARERAFAAHTAAGAALPAARCAMWIAQTLALKGSQAAAGGWLSRAARVLDAHGAADCAERGYLLLPVARAHYAARRYPDAFAAARSAEELGSRHGETDVVVVARHSQGRSLLRLERLDEGFARLDEVFVDVFPAGLRAPLLTGLVACSVVDGCLEVGAFDRAAEWTAALSSWCEEQPELVQFSAECLVHRAEVLLRRGFWQAALHEARAAARCAARDGIAPMAAAADYEQGAALGLLGRTAEAERAFAAAQQAGHDPLPALARLRLEQDRAGSAATALRRALAMADDPLRRARLLPAAVDVLLATDATADAAAAATELADLARRWPTGGLRAAALHATGAVALAEGAPAAAAGALREAWQCWAEQQAPDDAAGARLLLGRACAALGDEDAARAHRVAAEHARAGLRAAAPDRPARPALGLTPREQQVLALVAAGLTNRGIAERLVLSERTIDRHVSNILAKLDVPTRTAAAAVALQHGLG